MLWADLIGVTNGLLPGFLKNLYWIFLRLPSLASPILHMVSSVGTPHMSLKSSFVSTVNLIPSKLSPPTILQGLHSHYLFKSVHLWVLFHIPPDFCSCHLNFSYKPFVALSVAILFSSS